MGLDQRSLDLRPVGVGMVDLMVVEAEEDLGQHIGPSQGGDHGEEIDEEAAVVVHWACQTLGTVSFAALALG
jgi:hypothetical protein